MHCKEKATHSTENSDAERLEAGEEKMRKKSPCLGKLLMEPSSLEPSLEEKFVVKDPVTKVAIRPQRSKGKKGKLVEKRGVRHIFGGGPINWGNNIKLLNRGLTPGRPLS